MIRIVVGVAVGVALVAVLLLVFDRFMLRTERSRNVERRRREVAGEPVPTGAGAFGVGFEIWQPGYRAYVEEQQREENWIEQAESGAPPREIDLEKGIATVRVPRPPKA